MARLAVARTSVGSEDEGLLRAGPAGALLEAPRGGGGFGYDPIFYYPPLRATFAEITAEAKNAVSHRGRAVGRARALLLRWRAGGAPP